MSIPTCSHCNKKDNIKLRRQVASNGADQFGWYCIGCEKFANNKSPFIKKAIVQGWIDNGRLPLASLNDIPLIANYADDSICQVCGASGAAFHHWLPQCFNDLVDNHSLWPTAYLCGACHDKWHEIVTFYLPGRGKSELARIAKERYEHIQHVQSSSRSNVAR